MLGFGKCTDGPGAVWTEGQRHKWVGTAGHRPQVPAQRLGPAEGGEPGREGPEAHTVWYRDRKEPGWEPGENPGRQGCGRQPGRERRTPQTQNPSPGEASAGEGAELPDCGPNVSGVVCQAPSGSDSIARGMHTNNRKAGSEGLVVSLSPAWGQLASACHASGPPGRVGQRPCPCPMCPRRWQLRLPCPAPPWAL